MRSKLTILVMVLLLCAMGYCVEAPFPIMAAKKLATYAEANGYTANQIRNATPEQVFTHLDIDPNSPAADKYRAFETVIKGHAINFLGLQAPPTTVESIKIQLYQLFENLKIVYSSNIRLALLDLDGQYPDMSLSVSQQDPNIITIDLDGN